MKRRSFLSSLASFVLVLPALGFKEAFETPAEKIVGGKRMVMVRGSIAYAFAQFAGIPVEYLKNLDPVGILGEMKQQLRDDYDYIMSFYERDDKYLNKPFVYKEVDGKLFPMNYYYGQEIP